ncbi:uncharacterized protein LOC141661180 [Apium graveolens]|uniref:uncharacterized protein LOC141661180 n=1 Tax=Apium graveolens TaxID=4045 RepID=UPI003D7ACEBC
MSEFRDAVRKYGLDERRLVQFMTNDKNMCQVACQGDCSFYMWCSKDRDGEKCIIKTLIDEHLCTKPYSNKLATVKYLNDIYGDKIMKNAQWRIKEMIETIKTELEIEVPRIKILILRKITLEGMHDSLKEHYSRTRDFGHEILLSNLQNTVKISTTRLNETDKNKFKSMYVCYYAPKTRWKVGCRPIIGLDGCFLKTVCGGQLLSAVERDGNNQMFASLLLRRAFWNATCATHPAAHTKSMKQLERLSESAYQQLQHLDAKFWSKAFFATHSLADNIENNMSESFNAWIINERYMPLLTMMQEIHFKILTRMRVRRDDMLWSDNLVCPRIKKRLDVLVNESKQWIAAWDGMKKFQVKSGTRAVIVDLEARSCDCRVFDLTGILCAHAIAAIHERRHNPVNYLSDFYKRDKYLATYEHGLKAIRGKEFWEVDIIKKGPPYPMETVTMFADAPERYAIKEKSKWSDDEKVDMLKDAKVRNIMHNSLDNVMSNRVIVCKTAKKI